MKHSLFSFLGFILFIGGTVHTNVRADEVVTFFPTYAAQSTDGSSAVILLHAWIYDAEEHSIRRRAVLHLLAKRLGLDADAEQSKMFKDRARLFLVENQDRRMVTVHVAGKDFEIGPSQANGQIVTTISLPLDELAAHLETEAGTTHRFVRIHVRLAREQAREFSVSIPYLEPDGVSVISDIDDTIKLSEVANRRALLTNTFCKEFAAIPGMAEHYQAWSNHGASFHYISAAPWQLHSSLGKFLQTSGFPGGSLSLKSFRWKDSSFFDLFAKNDAMKRPAVESVLKMFPRRRFVLVGDSGEFDPELYGALARSYPEQIRKILIRNSSGEDPASPRFAHAFESLPPNCFSVFTDPAELETTAQDLFSD